MSGERVIEVEFLADDLREIRALMADLGDKEHGPEEVLHRSIAQFRRDEASWQELEHRHDLTAEAAKTELKRRETSALLVSMRSRTIRSEMQMHELHERVLVLQGQHLEQRQLARALRQSITHVRRRIAKVEDLLGHSADMPAAPESSTLREVLAQLWKRHV